MVRLNLKQEMKKVLEKQVRQIAKICSKKYMSLENIGVLTGQSGIALFFFYCSKYFDDDSFSETGVEIISSCMAIINSGYSYPTYCNGIAGFGWTLHHLSEEGFIELDLDDMLEPFDNYLQEQMKLDLVMGNYDILHGAIGNGFYFLKRYKGTQNSALKKKYTQILNSCVDSLEEMAIINDDTIKWESVLSYEKGTRGYNLGLSHGMSSILYFLSRLHNAKIANEKIEALIKGTTNYMMSFERNNAESVSLFPNWINVNESLQYKSREAWCYGDLGLGLAFRMAGHTIADSKLTEKGWSILKHSGERKSQDSTMVIDAGLCHGSFGNLQIFNRLNQIEASAPFEDTLNYWLKDGLKKYTGDATQPYKQFNGLSKSYELEFNLLEGISGIGLSIIDYLSPYENSWDECLFLR